MKPTERWPGLAQQVTGGLLLLVVVAVYGMALAGGRWPPGHPWSGLAETSLAAVMLISGSSAARKTGRAGRISIIAVSACGLVSAVLWLLAART